MAKKIKLSFVIPAHNEEHYIWKCLESIQEETKNKKCDFEIIVVNNASTDNTRKVALKYKGVKVINEPKKGLVNARRVGYLASSGELIANVDADSILPIGWIDKVIKEFVKNKSLVALSGPFIYYDLSKFSRSFVKVFYHYAFMLYIMNRYVVGRGSMLQGGNFVFKRSALKKIGGFSKNFDFYGEDADLARRLHKVGKVKFTFNLPMYSSGRRIAAEGMSTMAVRYSANYFSTMVSERPLTKAYVDVRSGPNQAVLKVRPENRKREMINTLILFIVIIVIPVLAIVLIYKIFFPRNQGYSYFIGNKITYEAGALQNQFNELLRSIK